MWLHHPPQTEPNAAFCLRHTSVQHLWPMVGRGGELQVCTRAPWHAEERNPEVASPLSGSVSPNEFSSSGLVCKEEKRFALPSSSLCMFFPSPSFFHKLLNYGQAESQIACYPRLQEGAGARGRQEPKAPGAPERRPAKAAKRGLPISAFVKCCAWS